MLDARRPLWRLATALLVALATVMSEPARAQFFPEEEPTNDQLIFGCHPGPIEPFVSHDPPLPPRPVPGDDTPLGSTALIVDGSMHLPPIAGSGFNLEHTLWSCQTFRPSLRRRLLEPFRPAIARVDTGQLPLAPEGVPAEQLTPEHYRAIMAHPRYQPSWEFIRRLNRRNIYVMLGIWGAPGAFTDDGTRRGALLPEYIDKYVEYCTTVIDYLVRDQRLSVWSITIANEPDGGDGTFIGPDDLAEIARRLGPALAPYGVKLYGPDTASAENALDYLDPFISDPAITPYMAAIATHQYFPSGYVEQLVQTVRDSGVGLPVYISEYTSFHYGSLDRGQESTDEVGFMLDSAATLATLYDGGVDAALYWDAVDYYQAGHSAITRWGLLQGPAEAFFPRKRYFGMLQILPYLQPGARILSTALTNDTWITPLAIRPPGDGVRDLSIIMVNQGGPMLVRINLQNLPDIDELEVYLTDEESDMELQGHVLFSDGRGELYLPARSIVTLAPMAAPDEE
jgi:O-glycosyl hydrolase